MRQELLFLRSDRRVNYVNGDVRIFESPALEESPAEVDDPDAIGLAGRFDWALPYSYPSGFDFQLKVRKIAPDGCVLLVNC
jgi:hypothetical protein